MTAKVCEVFNSISGEVSPFNQGRLTTFVRFSGCVAKCKWCDTRHESHVEVNQKDLDQWVADAYHKTNHLCITGGEPLMQPDYVSHLALTFANTWVETSGLIDFTPFIEKTFLVVDYKLDFSLREGYYCEVSIDDYLQLTDRDFIKFVVEDSEQFMEFWSVYRYLKVTKKCKATIAVAPVHGVVEPETLVSWMLRSDINDAVLNVQLHKLVGLQ